MWVKYDLIDKRHKIKYKYAIYYGIKIDSIDNRLHPVCERKNSCKIQSWNTQSYDTEN